MLEIEIVETNIINSGIEVFARAWQDGQQIGFGADGSVDIERFRIINPPVLVPDDNGNVPVEQAAIPEMGVEQTTYHYREDPEEAVLQVLERNISGLKNKHDDKKIVPGKIGQTTTTVYAGANDGYVFDAEPTWAGVRSAGGQGSSFTATILAVQASRESASNWIIYRSPMPFNTSAVGGDTVSSAVLYFTPQTKDSSGSDNQSVCLDLVTTITPATGDYAISNWATTDQASRVAFGTMSVDTETSLSLNATGISNINGSGTTNFGFRASYDMDNTTPTDPGGNMRIFPYASEQSGTTRDPRLVIEHAAGGSSIKSIDGVLKANIKSFNGVVLG